MARIHNGRRGAGEGHDVRPLYGNAQALELLAACMAFATNQRAVHPEVAAWVIQQHRIVPSGVLVARCPSKSDNHLGLGTGPSGTALMIGKWEGDQTSGPERASPNIRIDVEETGG